MVYATMARWLSPFHCYHNSAVCWILFNWSRLWAVSVFNCIFLFYLQCWLVSMKYQRSLQILLSILWLMLPFGHWDCVRQRHSSNRLHSHACYHIVVSQATPFNLCTRERGSGNFAYMELFYWNAILELAVLRDVTLNLYARSVLACGCNRRVMLNDNKPLIHGHVTTVTLKSCNLIGRSKILEQVQVNVCEVTGPSFSWDCLRDYLPYSLNNFHGQKLHQAQLPLYNRIFSKIMR
jgi:hypothetical protein